MLKKFVEIEKDYSKNRPIVIFEYDTGKLVYVSQSVQNRDYFKTIANPTFQVAFPTLNMEEIKEKVKSSENNRYDVEIKFGKDTLSFKFSKIEIDNKNYLMAILLVDSIFFETFGEGFASIRRRDMFMTAYLDESYHIVGCNKNYKKKFEKASDKIIGSHIFHNIVNYEPYLSAAEIAHIIKNHNFWYGSAFLKEDKNVFSPYIVLAYERDTKVINSKFEVHFFPMRFFGHGTIFQYAFHSGGNSNLYTRTVFEGIMNKYLSTNNSDKFLLFMDINNFKSINDSHGHECGDYVLRIMSSILSDIFSDFVVSRYGGDEFTVYIEKNLSRQEIILMIQEVEEQIKNKVGDKFDVSKNHISVGISKYNKNGTTFNELINAADKAMYVAKRENRLYKFGYDEE